MAEYMDGGAEIGDVQERPDAVATERTEALPPGPGL